MRRNMASSARRIPEAPGRNVARKAGLNRSTRDSAQASPAHVLRHKAQEAGKELLEAEKRRQAYTAVAAKMARTVHAVVNRGEPYRPFFEGVSPDGRISL